MTQPVAWKEGIVSKGTPKNWYATESGSNQFDFKLRVFVAPSGTDIMGRLSSFTLDEALPNEVTQATGTAVLSAERYVGDPTIAVTSIPAYFPSAGEAFISYGDQYMLIRWTSRTSTVFSGVTWPTVNSTRFRFVTGSLVQMWVDVSKYIGGENAISLNAARNGYVVSWTGTLRGEGWNGALFAKDNYVVIAREFSYTPLVGVWQPERLYRLGIIRNTPEYTLDSEKRDPFTVEISGLLDLGRTTQAGPLSIGNQDIAGGISPVVSTTLVDPESIQNEKVKGDFAGVVPSIQKENITDGNRQTFWVSDGVPFQTRNNPVFGDYGLVIDEVFPYPPVGRGIDYSYIVLFNPSGHPKQANWYKIVVSRADLGWATWTPANPDVDGDTGSMGAYVIPPGEGGGAPWASYPSHYHELPRGVDIPPYSRVVICRNATRFMDMFGSGEAQIIEVPSLALPTSNAIIKSAFWIDGAAPGVHPGDTIAYGTPTYQMPSYLPTPNAPNPPAGYALRRRTSGNSADPFVLDVQPTPGDLRKKRRREYVSIDLGANGFGLYLKGNIGTGTLTQIEFQDASGEPAPTFHLNKSGQIRFAVSSEVITYANNDGRKLTGITRGGTPEAVTAGTEVFQMVNGDSTHDAAVNNIYVATKPSGPVFGSMEVFASKTGASSVDYPPIVILDREDYQEGGVGDSEYIAANVTWTNDWDLLWSGNVYNHSLRLPIDTRRSRHYLVSIGSMPIRTMLIGWPPGVMLSGNVVISSPVSAPTYNLIGTGLFVWHAGSHYELDDVVNNGNGTYTLVNVQPRPGEETSHVSNGDQYVYVGNNRARMSTFEIHQANLMGARDSLMVGEGNTETLIKYIVNRTLGLPENRITHIDKPIPVTRLLTSKGAVTGVLSDLCRRNGLLLVEWGDMTLEVFGDPHWPGRHGYTDSVYSFGEANSVRLLYKDTNPEDVSQVEVSILDPSTGESQTARYPGVPYARGRLHREPDLQGDISNNKAWMTAAAIFRQLRNGKSTSIMPTTAVDWLYPPMKVEALVHDRNSPNDYLAYFTVESVSHTWSFGPKSYGCEVVVRRV